MIFYLAVDDKGDTKIVGTQAEAKAINKGFQQIDIPVDKAGLMAWVQQMLDETLNTGGGHPPASLSPAKPEGPIAEVISETLYDLLGLGGGDGDTIAEYTSRLVSLIEAEKDSITPSINPEAKPAPAPAPAPLARPLNELLNVSYIQDWLINDAKQGEIERIYNAIGCRVGEILRDAR